MVVAGSYPDAPGTSFEAQEHELQMLLGPGKTVVMRSSARHKPRVFV